MQEEQQPATTTAAAPAAPVEHSLDKQQIRWNFTDIFHSFMVVFRALCGEWVESMYDCILVSGDKSSIVYFHALAFIGSFLVSYYFVTFFFSFRFSSGMLHFGCCFCGSVHTKLGVCVCVCVILLSVWCLFTLLPLSSCFAQSNHIHLFASTYMYCDAS